MLPSSLYAPYVLCSRSFFVTVWPLSFVAHQTIGIFLIISLNFMSVQVSNTSVSVVIVYMVFVVLELVVISRF